ncbi:MAG TPA: hypothetical protein DCY20_01090 [Firmicutes bacterium]|nr:hypothetical protein [Bacillota bacterium]
MLEETTKFNGLRVVDVNDGVDKLQFLLGSQEVIKLSYKSVRDRLIVTNKKLLIIDKQGMTGRKKEYMIIPHNKISSFSCESDGIFDLDASLSVWASGLGKIEFEFLKGTDIRPLASIINEAICE